MSTKAKIGKEWVKCQIVLAETGETLHLTFAPGQTRKKIVAHIDGRTDVGWIELAAISGAAAPHDATLGVSLKGEGVRPAKGPAAPTAAPPATLPTPPKAKPAAPAPAPVVAAPAAPAEAPAAPKPAATEKPSEEITTSEVQDSAADTTTAAGGRRGRPRQNPDSERN